MVLSRSLTIRVVTGHIHQHCKIVHAIDYDDLPDLLILMLAAILNNLLAYDYYAAAANIHNARVSAQLLYRINQPSRITTSIRPRCAGSAIRSI